MADNYTPAPSWGHWDTTFTSNSFQLISDFNHWLKELETSQPIKTFLGSYFEFYLHLATSCEFTAPNQWDEVDTTVVVEGS